MIIIGLTGSIGMGKSTVAGFCRRLRVPVSSADDVVHDLLRPKGAASTQVAAAFPQAVIDGAIDRQRLGALVFGQPEQLRHLEAILYPLVTRQRDRFLQALRVRRAQLVVLDIPLLFEKHLEGRVDVIITVSAPAYVQRSRVMARPGMTMEKLSNILAQQMPDREKRRRSDYVIRTGGSKAATFRQLRQILSEIDSSGRGA